MPGLDCRVAERAVEKDFIVEVPTKCNAVRGVDNVSVDSRVETLVDFTGLPTRCSAVRVVDTAGVETAD